MINTRKMFMHKKNLLSLLLLLPATNGIAGGCCSRSKEISALQEPFISSTITIKNTSSSDIIVIQQEIVANRTVDYNRRIAAKTSLELLYYYSNLGAPQVRIKKPTDKHFLVFSPPTSSVCAVTISDDPNNTSPLIACFE